MTTWQGGPSKLWHTFHTIFVDKVFALAWFLNSEHYSRKTIPHEPFHIFFTKTSPAKTPLQKKGCFAMNLCKSRRWGKNTSHITPLKFNMGPDNTPLEKENNLPNWIPNHHFQVQNVKLWGCNSWCQWKGARKGTLVVSIKSWTPKRDPETNRQAPETWDDWKALLFVLGTCTTRSID